jgi:hypothetical protein
MKRAVAFCFLLACCGVLLGDSSKPGPSSRKPASLLEDLVRLTRAGSSDVTVLAYAKAHRLALPPELSDSDLRWLRDSGVSELVVRYMAAFDVRASGESAQEDIAYGSSEDTDQPRAAYSYSDSDRGGYPERYAGNYADNYSDNYADSYSDAYPGYGYYPSYGYGYYPYPLFFVDRDGFFHRFRGRDQRFDGHRGFDRGRGGFDRGRGFRGHRGVVVGHGGSRDAWRERGFVGRRGSSVVVGPRGSGRPAFARGGFSAGPHGFRGPRGGVSGHGGFGRPGFSGGPHSGGGFSRGPRVAAGSSGGRGRR